MQNMLIIGSDSTIGSHLKKNHGTRGETIYGTTRHHNRCNQTTFFLDLFNPDAFHISDHITIDTVIFCAAMSKIKECEENKAISYQINVESTIKLARYLKNRFNPFMIFLSSNAVFDGSKPFFLETDSPCPINYYGQCKAETEIKLTDITEKLAILRLTKVIYPNHPLIEKWIKDLQCGKNIYPFNDLRLAPISLDAVSTAIKKLTEQQKTGFFHLSGDQDISYAELAKKLSEKIKSNMRLVIKSTSHYQTISPYNSLDMTCSKKFLQISETNIKTIIDEIMFSHPVLY